MALVWSGTVHWSNAYSSRRMQVKISQFASSFWRNGPLILPVFPVMGYRPSLSTITFCYCGVGEAPPSQSFTPEILSPFPYSSSSPSVREAFRLVLIHVFNSTTQPR